MSYKVFARKWRPDTFDDVVGQSHVVDTVKRAIETDRVAHAYLFSGTRGVGKTSLARLLARSLNCDEGPTVTPCGVCSPCRSIQEGNNFDVVEVDGASNNGVDEVRELRDSVSYSSFDGKYKIFIIDEVHMLSKGAFNALLKTIEEPPERVVFILATTEPHRVPDTIHSRCQRFEFKTVSLEAIAEHLKTICTREGISFDDAAVEIIARKACGSIRDSLSLLEQACAFSTDGLSAAAVRESLGLIGEDLYHDLMEAVIAGDPRRAVAFLEQALGSGYDLQEFITGYMEYLRKLLFSGMNEGTQSFSDLTEGDLLRIIEVIRQCEFDMGRSSLPRFQVELMLIKLARMERTVEIEDLLAGRAPLSRSSQNAETSGNSLPSTPERPSPAQESAAKAEPALKDVRDMPEPGEQAHRAQTRRDDTADAKASLSAQAAPHNDSAPGPDAGEPAQETDESPVPPKTGEDAPPGDAPSAEDDQEETVPKETRPYDPAHGTDFWYAFLAYFSHRKPLWGAWLEAGRPVEFDRDSVDLRFSPIHSFQQQELAAPETKKQVEALLRDFCGTPLTLHLTVAAGDGYVQEAPENAPGTEEPKTPGPHAASLHDEAVREPIIDTVLDIFNGELI
ncbi:MAG: DNA polymerase III subunit gamma/tau [Fibrobacterota bacterium]